MRLVLAWAAVVAAALVLAACGGADGNGEGDAAVAQGAEVWAANCAVCHGPDGGGTTVGPPLVHDVYEPGHHSDDSFRRAVSQGSVAHHWEFGDMPPQPQVTEEETEAVIAYVRQLQRDAGIIP